MERSKLEVQLKLFTKQMTYQREKDHRLYANVVAANENARLSILKQGKMVNCLAHLSSVLSKNLITSNSHAVMKIPEVAERQNYTFLAKDYVAPSKSTATTPASPPP